MSQQLVDGYWMRIGQFALSAGLTRDQVRGLAERRELETSLDERGYMLIAARDLHRIRNAQAIARAREGLVRTLAMSSAFTDGNGRQLPIEEYNRKFDHALMTSMREMFPGYSDAELRGRR